MSKKKCFWTRQLELQLVEFVRQREFIWKPAGNTNYQIQQKYKAYAEFAARLGRGFTARSVRDRWVNIRSTYNHNLRKVELSQQTAHSSADLYVPCWPLWKPLQFLKNATKKEFGYNEYHSIPPELKVLDMPQKEEAPSDFDDSLTVKQRNQRTDRPRKKFKPITSTKTTKCKRIINDLVNAMKPLTDMMSADTSEQQGQSYWFFGKHVTERLNAMRENDAACARQEILKILKEFNDDLPDQHCDQNWAASVKME